MYHNGGLSSIIKYIPLQQGLRQPVTKCIVRTFTIIKYIPLQQGLRHVNRARITLLAAYY